MNPDDRKPNLELARGDTLLAFGLAAVLLGIWLLQTTDPPLLAIWGVAFVIIGTAGAITGAGVLLRLWK